MSKPLDFLEIKVTIKVQADGFTVCLWFYHDSLLIIFDLMIDGIITEYESWSMFGFHIDLTNVFTKYTDT